MDNLSVVTIMRELFRDLFDFSFARKINKEKQSYAAPASVSNLFAWEEFDNEKHILNFVDGKSCGAVYELLSIPTEGQDEAFIHDLRLQIADIIADTFPRYETNQCPWIISIYLSDDTGLEEVYETMKAYPDERAQGKPYTKLYLKWWQRHCDALSSEQGLFIDPTTNLPAKGCMRRVRLVMYRNITAKAKFSGASNAEEELANIAIRLESQLETAEIVFTRYEETHFVRWMTKWLSPQPKGYRSSNEYVYQNPVPTDEEKPLGFDLTQTVFTSTPVSNEKTGIWKFDGIPHKMIPILGFKKIPVDGVLTAEKKESKSNRSRFIAAFDRFPEGSVFVMTTVLVNEKEIATRIEHIENRASKSNTPEAYATVEDADTVKRMVVDKNYIFPSSMCLYVKAPNETELRQRMESAFGRLNVLGFDALDATDDLVSLDAYMRFLPFNYTYEYDKRSLFRSRLCSLKQIASVFPVYGRSRGTGHPGYTAFNRQFEALMIDQIRDRVNNAHMLTFGTTGSGKSAFVISCLAQSMAMLFPRMVLVDAGASLRQLVYLWKSLGMNVNLIEIKMKRPEFSLNPFALLHSLIKQLEKMNSLSITTDDYEAELAKRLDEVTSAQSVEDLKNDDEEEEDDRDFLLDFVASAVLMITGADEKEMDLMTREDRFYILEAVKIAARKAYDEGYSEMIAGDLADALNALAQQYLTSEGAGDTKSAERIATLEKGLRTFISTPINNWYFNERGKPLPEADVTWLELGIFKDNNPSYTAPRALVFISLMNNSMTQAERYKDEGRPMIFFGDECHILTNNAITAASVIQCAKMSRKVNLWIWLATQNVSDFPAAAKKIVSMMEYLYVLYCDEAERKDILSFRSLTKEQTKMIATLQKEKGKYMENVLICNRGSYLFRNIPPREVLAIAGTDGEENKLRKTLAKEYDCSLVEASLLMAQKYRGEDYDLDKIREELCRVQS